ncbi:succinate dehydrogenase assembly factor 2 [Pseudahrensia aquimaris]|uniref:FAD assembly factor SdhE n=1 Tax=Pseudahrensia aquimaris TaxID=744461 RepID=A0ABW3FM53_9HYPH
MRTSANLDPRRKMLLFRAWHRGTKEMDLVLGNFADAELENLTDAELDDLEQLMTAPDPEIYKWLSGTHPIPENWDTPIVHRIRLFHGTADTAT